ncbi:MAG: DUF2147 domain-containing protein [Akkermansia sp.]|nr:DUF2147 domain-containing protein [Akkermansia sp.]
MKNFLLTAGMALCALAAQATANITGYWTTIDDETREAKSVVQVYEYQGKYYGRVVELLKNPGAKAKIKGSPAIKGLTIIWDLEKDGDTYSGGEILDPQKGKVYGCEMWREGKKLIVRGKIAFLGRNQTWLPNTTFKGTEEKPTPKKPAL